ncbi:GNAT family N-acetyltransferase [Vulcaniibacterium thermophilum]|uniref:N-acetyltransferase n=1 Tax=Vulcaniibacterium thermophilum TaxID=1169913 RepID=A0A918Z388_9GAMM|nr:GNAT family N-acetyltransferase [Vulcaniibacterium thermophilum]GHE35696.1 N-acetyltransferase [Vulcaniibacterium thermophilum]
MTDIRIERVRGRAIADRLEDLARLRIAVFREWPYLYDGDPGYEADYLRTYVDAAGSIAVLALDGDRVIGASTGLPLEEETEAFKAPVVAAGLDPARVFYCGESVLLPEYRGRGLGHRFFDEREAHARALGGFEWTAFCAVDRAGHDPRRPPAHRDNDAFWRKRGYAPRPEMRVELPWKEIGQGEIAHTLTFWLRPLEAA